MSDNAPDGRSSGASVLLNGLKVLETFTIEEPLLGVTEIAGRVGMHKSSVSRILALLEHGHYVERDSSSGRFRLGLGVIGLAGPLLADLDVRRAAQPVLERLSRRTGETAALTVWNGHGAVVVEQVASTHNVKHTAAIGTRYVSPASASVQTFLAARLDADARALFHRLTLPAAGQGPDGWDGYRGTLEGVRAAGFAVNDGCTSAEEVGLAAPVHDHRGETVGVVLLSAPRFRVPRQLLDPLGRSVVDAAGEIDERLGYRPSGPQTE